MNVEIEEGDVKAALAFACGAPTGAAFTDATAYTYTDLMLWASLAGVALFAYMMAQLVALEYRAWKRQKDRAEGGER